MDDALLFLVRLVLNQNDQLRRSLARELPGRGYSLVPLIEAICERVEHETETVAAQLPIDNQSVVGLKERELLRLRQELSVAHQVVAHFQGDSGRRDLPVGLLHLVDELVRDLLPKRADPIIHLDIDNMYSTLSIVDSIRGLLRGNMPPEPHPVAFNLPALDPANALLSPILAHEVGHTAWRQGLRQELDGRADLKGASDRLRTAAHDSGAEPTVVLRQFDGWRQELLCDSLATALTGPSFLLASAVFLPGPAVGTLGTHPYPHDRLALCLRILERLGWTEVLRSKTPNILSWCQHLAGRDLLTGDALETGLRDACQILEPTIIDVALEAAKNAVLPSAFVAVEEDVFEHLQLEIPPISFDGNYASPWLIIAAGWIHELHVRGDNPESLASVSSDRRLNAFLVKAVELSGVGRLWSMQ